MTELNKLITVLATGFALYVAAKRFIDAARRADLI